MATQIPAAATAITTRHLIVACSSVCELSQRQIHAGLNGSGAEVDWRRKASRLDRKPYDDRDDGDDDGGPHQWRNLFRTAASRRVVGGVIEFTIHSRYPFSAAGDDCFNLCRSSETPPGPCPKAKPVRGRRRPSTVPVVPR